MKHLKTLKKLQKFELSAKKESDKCYDEYKSAFTAGYYSCKRKYLQKKLKKQVQKELKIYDNLFACLNWFVKFELKKHYTFDHNNLIFVNNIMIPYELIDGQKVLYTWHPEKEKVKNSNPYLNKQ